MKEIADNEYNLNISRYISTAAPDKEIDLLQINQELVAIEENIKSSTNKHNEFLKELGLPILL